MSGEMTAVWQSYTGGQHAGARGRLRVHGAPAAAARRAWRRRASARLQRADGAPLGRPPAQRLAPQQEPLVPALRAEPVAGRRRSTADQRAGVVARPDRRRPPARVADQFHHVRIS